MKSDSEILSGIKGFLAGSRRHLLITEKISQELVEWLMIQMLLFETECFGDNYTWKPITLVLETGGGDLAAAYNLGDFIQTLNCPVHGLVAFNTSSAGVDILQMCSRRMMFPSAWLHCHYQRRTAHLVYADSRRADREYEEMRRRTQSLHTKRLALYAARTNRQPEDIEKIFQDGEDLGQDIDSYFAKELGLIDEIVQPFKLYSTNP
jgi:ATP-dependent protease ClpP protease subunit